MVVQRSRTRTVRALVLGGVLVIAGCGAGATGGIGASSGVAGGASSTAPVLTPTSGAPAITQSTASVGTATEATRTPAAPSPLHPKYTLTNADAGSTYHLQLGETIDLALRAGTGFQNWEVSAPDATVLKATVDPAAAAARGMTLRAFQAVGAGQTDIAATSKPSCVAGQACPQLIQGFRVTVVVDG